jgi:hypothetical protein
MENPYYETLVLHRVSSNSSFWRLLVWKMKKV